MSGTHPRGGLLLPQQVADIVLLFTRPDAHGHGESDPPGAADIVAKNRSGRVNRVAVGFQGHCCRFTPHGRDSQPPGAAAGAFY